MNLPWYVWLIGLPVIFVIVFVRAGQFGGANGGEQTAAIFKAAGGAGSQLVSALEGGTVNASSQYYA